jgi:hypothetical protein
MKIRLFQGVGSDVTKRFVSLDSEWPDGLQLPSRGDRVLVQQEMVEVDHVEYMPGDDPVVMIELVDITQIRGDESPEDWAKVFRRGWELR